MSLSSRPNLLRAAAHTKALWLAVPAIAALMLLGLLGHWAANTPPPVTVAEAEPSSTATAAPAPASEASSTATAAPAVPAATATAEPAKTPEPAGAPEAPKEPVATTEAPKAPVAATFSPDQKKEIEQIIKSYLVANPEIFVDIQNALEEKMEKEQAQKLKVAIAENASEIYRAKEASVAGNPDGEITVVEFFDYNCGYCKHGLKDVAKLVETDPKVRVVFKELPILSKGSEEASHVALAAQKQGKYWELHKAMLSAKGQMNEAAALQIAEKLGLDMDKLKKDMASPEVKAEIEKSAALAKKLGVNGTPHFLIGDRAVAGAPEDLYDQLERNVTELRKQGCSYC
jgi:protein-disulfide isomerase